MQDQDVLNEDKKLIKQVQAKTRMAKAAAVKVTSTKNNAGQEEFKQARPETVRELVTSLKVSSKNRHYQTLVFDLRLLHSDAS